MEIAQQRLWNQEMSGSRFAEPEELVQWLGAVQAQDYGAAKWALGLRLQGATDAHIEQAFTEGRILRTHVMRPTWHFVAPEDLRWLLALTGPRVQMSCAFMYRQLELDERTRARSGEVLAKALQGGKQMTREELGMVLQQAGLAADNLLRLTHFMIHAELEGLICSGGRRGKQFTYALLEERVLTGKQFERDEAVAELARRYFTSHGPATVQDFAWWSGLTIADARMGVEILGKELCSEEREGQRYWSGQSEREKSERGQRVYLLPNYDEYIVGYTDRSAIFDEAHMQKLGPRGNVLFSHTILLDGRVVGIWKRIIKKKSLVFIPELFVELKREERNELEMALERYGEFLGLTVEMGTEEIS